MEVPSSQPPICGSQSPLELQPLILPQYFHPAGSPKPHQLPRMEQPFPAPQAMGTQMAPSTPQAPLSGFQMAPCGCFFDTRVFCFEWIIPSPTPGGSASVPSTEPGAPQGWVPPLGLPLLIVRYRQRGREEAPEMPPSAPGSQHLEEQLRHMNTSCFGGTTQGSPSSMGNITTLSSDIPMGISSISDFQGVGNSSQSLDASPSKETLLEEAMRLFGCSMEMEGLNQHSPSSDPTLGDIADLDDLPYQELSSLQLPEELLSPDYSVPEVTSLLLEMEQLQGVWVNPEEPSISQGHTLQDKTKQEKQGKKRQSSSLLRTSCKRRAPACSNEEGECV